MDSSLEDHVIDEEVVEEELFAAHEEDNEDIVDDNQFEDQLIVEEEVVIGEEDQYYEEVEEDNEDGHEIVEEGADEEVEEEVEEPLEEAEDQLEDELDDILDDNNDTNDDNDDQNDDNDDRDDRIDDTLDLKIKEELIQEEEDQRHVTRDEPIGDDGVYQWSAFTGLRVKTFSKEELELFRRPFEFGWTREVVLRGTVTSSGKKIGDVYYFSPDKRHKLRSYVNMQDFLKRSNSPLKAENFTFARQPIFRPPQEIVRHAMQRGQQMETRAHNEAREQREEERARDARSQRTNSSTNSDLESEQNSSIAEGRAKRKRVAPSRFEDENYESESPFKKKTIITSGQSVVTQKTNGVKETGNQSKQVSLQEKRRHLQHQLLQQVHQKMVEKDQEDNVQLDLQVPEVKMEVEEPEVERKSISARKSICVPKPEVEDRKPGSQVGSDDKSDQEVTGSQEKGEPEVDAGSGAPCSMHCPGRRGMLPNLMCSRCFCLYHLDCVKGGVFLEEPRVFVCPNCLSPEDHKKSEMDQSEHLKSALIVTTPLLLQQPIKSQRSTFAPILPKPPQLQQSALYQQMFNKSGKTSNNTNQKTSKAQYRVTTGPNGHSMVVKDPRVRPKLKRKDQTTPLVNGGPSLLYRPAPIAPIGPMKLTPAQMERQLRSILVETNRPMREKRSSRFANWMERRSQSPMTSLLSPYQSLNQVLQYLCVKDLIRLRQVSRVFSQLSQQPFLWRSIKLKGIQLNDWLFLAKNIVEANGSHSLDFENVRQPPNEEQEVDFWRNFASIVDYLKSVRLLKFGSIPSFVLEEVATAAITDNPYNSFSNLEEIQVKNVFEEDNGESKLDFLQDFHSLKNLKTLSINSKSGFTRNEETNALLSKVFKQMSLKSLSLLSLKDFRSEDFLFLTSLQSLQRLAIGSCRHWFDSHVVFTCLQELKGLKELKLQEIRLDDKSRALNETLESLVELESLQIDDLRIESSVGSVLIDFSLVLSKKLKLKKVSFSSNDSQTNVFLADLLKKLDNCDKLLWKVNTLVEDSGECFVPFKEDDVTEEDPKLMDLLLLNEIIQSELSHALIEIIPQ